MTVGQIVAAAFVALFGVLQLLGLWILNNISTQIRDLVRRDIERGEICAARPITCPARFQKCPYYKRHMGEVEKGEDEEEKE